MREVILIGERDAFLGENASETGEVNRLGVGDHAVAIENDGFEHAGLKFLMPIKGPRSEKL